MKKLITIICIVLMLTVIITGCSQDDTATKDSAAPTQTATTAPTVAATKAPETQAPTTMPTSAPQTEAPTEEPTKKVIAPANVDPNATYEYEVREIWCENNGKRIYGEAYIPIADGRVPLVIHSHGMGSNHEAGASYGKKYAQRGIALYAFDFPGGSNSNNENRSDGSTTEMSVLTQASDVAAILNTAKTWDFVDTDRIFLQGGSQGGLVTAIAGVQHQSEIAGLILHYPAFAMHDAMRSRFSNNDEIPDEFVITGMTFGRIFAEDLMSYDVRNDISSFNKPVCIIQGSDDNLVLPSVSYEAYNSYPNAEYRVVEGAGHGFSGTEHDEATEYGLDFIYRMIGVI